mgnify:CR=1 FL=1|tara:strand:+ start:147 stop:482 length:336 start_codon:yes stop_codon:yes gene_type:complete
MVWPSPEEFLSYDPWDVTFQILIWIIVFVMIHRYTDGPSGLDVKSIFFIVILAIPVYYSVFVFANGTASGTNLDHPVLVLLYLIGGGITIYSIDGMVKKIDSWYQRNIGKK